MFKNLFTRVLCVVALLAILASCAPAATPVPQPTAAPQIVEVTKIVAGTPVVQQVVVTATPQPTKSPYDKNAQVLIWIDAAREKVAGKYADLYPEKAKPVKLTTTNYGELGDKILFWNNVGGGWPDGSFAGPSSVPLINDAAHSYLADFTPFVDKKIIEGFAPGSLENCYDGQKLYCLRNDIAHFVLYYNAPLLKQWGMKPPTTYEEMLAQSKQVAKEHPGYQYVAAQQEKIFFNMLHSAQCPYQQALGNGKVRINALHENCKKAMTWMDEMVASGALLPTDMFGSEATNLVKSGKWVLIPSSSWFADYAFVGAYYEKDDPKLKGLVGVTAMPKWNGQDRPYTFWWGGGSWVMSRHSKNPQAVADFMTYMTTEAIVEQGTFPAYLPAADKWLKNMSSKTQFEDPAKAAEVLKTEAGHMWTKGFEAPVNADALWAPIESKVLAKKLTYTQALEEFQKVMVDGAKKLYYDVVTTGLDK
jgi:multiple sugar transport system substrate-binding protein